jgi:hypothetical protein
MKHAVLAQRCPFNQFSSVLTFRPQWAQFPRFMAFTPYIEVSCSSSNATPKTPRLAALPGVAIK